MKKLLFVLLSLLLIVPIPANAQSTKVEQSSDNAKSTQDSIQAQSKQLEVKGLEVTPFIFDLDVEKGKEISSKVDLVNHSTSPLIITVSPRDFLPGDDGQPQFIPDPTINDPTFSLAEWVELGTASQFTIQPGQLVSVPFKLHPPQNAEDGTHYGALLFSYVGISATGSASEIQQSVGTIILVRYGVARELGKTTLTADKHLLWGSDQITFQNVFEDTGNVHVQPKGEIYIRNIFGQTVATQFVNRDAANVLPKTKRTFINTWYPSNFAFGRFTAESILNYGRGHLETKSIQVIWILPWYLLLIFISIIFFLTWFWLHGIHLYHRRVVKKHIERTTTQD